LSKGDAKKGKIFFEAPAKHTRFTIKLMCEVLAIAHGLKKHVLSGGSSHTHA
jgi:hypothetical protein